MFARVFALLPLALVAVAQDAPKCDNNDKPYCCDQALKPNDPQVQSAFDSWNLADDWNNFVAQLSGELVGMGCSPLDGPAINCPANPLCCGEQIKATHGQVNTLCALIPKDQ